MHYKSRYVIYNHVPGWMYMNTHTFSLQVVAFSKDLEVWSMQTLVYYVYTSGLSLDRAQPHVGAAQVNCIVLYTVGCS